MSGPSTYVTLHVRQVFKDTDTRRRWASCPSRHTQRPPVCVRCGPLGSRLAPCARYAPLSMQNRTNRRCIIRQRAVFCWRYTSCVSWSRSADLWVVPSMLPALPAHAESVDRNRVAQMDSLGWVCYKIIQFESIRQAQVAGFLSPVLFVTALTTLETTIEIITSALVPRFYYLIEREQTLNPGALAVFVMRVYTASIIGALVLSLILAPCLLGGAIDANGYLSEDCEESSCRCSVGQGADQCTQWMWAGANGSQPACCLHNGVEVDLCAVSGSSACPLTPTALSVALVASYCVLYCFLNQLSDAGREMAMTTWLSVFEGTHLVFPAFLPARLAVRRPASSDACSTLLQILRYVVQGVAGVFYVAVRSRAGMRFGMLLFFTSLGSLMGLCILLGGWCGGCIASADGGNASANGATSGKSSADSGDGGEAARSGGGAAAAKPAGTGAGAAAGSSRRAEQVAPMPVLVRAYWLLADDASAVPGGGDVPMMNDGPTSPAGKLAAGKLAAHAAVASHNSSAHSSASAGLEAEQLVLWPWQLARWELALTCFLVCARGLPQQAGDTVLAYISSSSTVAVTIAQAIDGGSAGATALAESLFASVGAALWMLTLAILIRKARHLPSHPPNSPPTAASSDSTAAQSGHSVAATPASSAPPSWLRESPPPAVRVGAPSASSIFAVWVRMLWGLLLFMGLAGVLLALPSWLRPSIQLGAGPEAALSLLALALYMPYLPIAKLLDVRIDAFLMEHSRSRAPSIVYWSNVLLVIVVWPLLLLKWTLVGVTGGGNGGTLPAVDGSACGTAGVADAQRESSELGLVVFLTGSLLLIALGYFSAVDPSLSPRASVHAALREHARSYKAGRVMRDLRRVASPRIDANAMVRPGDDEAWASGRTSSGREVASQI